MLLRYILPSIISLNLYGAQLNVTITSIKDNSFPIRYSLCDHEKCYLKEGPYLLEGWSQPHHHKAQFVISNIKSGFYSLTFFQDQNGDGLFDQSIFQVPKEPFGISRIQSKKDIGLKRPSWQRVRVWIDQEKSITIPMIYW